MAKQTSTLHAAPQKGAARSAATAPAGRQAAAQIPAAQTAQPGAHARLQQGATRIHRPFQRGTSQAHPGVSHLDAVAHRNTGFQPLPVPLGLPPYHYSLADNFPHIAANITAANKMVFHVMGDSGGVQDATYQDDVAAQLVAQLGANDPASPQFLYHVGDVVYFTGMHDAYYAQFYEPYAQYAPPILAIPGNHDGEVDDPTAQTSLDGWVDYFMQKTPDVDPISKDAPRVGLSLPNPYWTLVTPLATFVGMYTNVPEGGSIDSVQQQWVTNEFATADKNLPLIFALHHPIYSFDTFHSGSSRMSDVLENAIRDTGRVPNLVLAGHVHDYQVIEQTIDNNTIPFVVSGNGGYHNLHQVHSKPGDKDPSTGAVLKYARVCWGFLTMTIDGQNISWVSTEIDKNGKVTHGQKFTYPAAPIVMQNPALVPSW